LKIAAFLRHPYNLRLMHGEVISMSVATHERSRTTVAGLRREWPLAATLLTVLLFFCFGHTWFTYLANPVVCSLLFVWLFVAILLAAFAIVRHAEAIADRLGEPLGTLILTLAVTGLEVMMIAAVMYSTPGETTLARDAMFAVIMIVLNGMVGLSLVVGGLRYKEQTYNLMGASAFLAVIVPLAVLGLVLPNYTTTTPGPTLSTLQSVFLIVMSIGLYGVFLAIQTVRHRSYFIGDESAGTDAHHHATGSIAFHALMLFAYLLPVVILAKKLALPVNAAIEVLHAPPALGGLLVSMLVLSPESLAAVRAALANQLQRSVNVLLGSVLATIGLSIPAVLIIGFITHRQIILGISPINVLLLALTLAGSILTFSGTRTNVLLGAVHLLLFVAYLILIFD
jgi:Ca2+:H+ antiporter